MLFFHKKGPLNIIIICNCQTLPQKVEGYIGKAQGSYSQPHHWEWPWKYAQYSVPVSTMDIISIIVITDKSN